MATIPAGPHTYVPYRKPPRHDLGSRCTGFALAVAINVAVLFTLLYHGPTQQALHKVAPIMVSLITPPPETRPEPPKPPPSKVKPKYQPVEPPPVVAAPVEPTPSFVPAPEIVVPAPPVVVAVQSGAPPVTTAEVRTAAPPPIIPPRFNADYLKNPAPPYPSLARRMREQGKVVLRVLVSAEGAPERVELNASSGSQRLDETALETVKHWKFVAARQGDQTVPAWVLVPIVFSLDS